jgi:hypothetical protein
MCTYETDVCGRTQITAHACLRSLDLSDMGSNPSRNMDAFLLYSFVYAEAFRLTDLPTKEAKQV